jgi:hypothetical protein
VYNGAEGALTEKPLLVDQVHGLSYCYLNWIDVHCFKEQSLP